VRGKGICVKSVEEWKSGKVIRIFGKGYALKP
jgi:hypothetical protein